ncbi:hypothetical protein TeGR_g11869, partial [Tetraparma gracilis]
PPPPQFAKTIYWITLTDPDPAAAAHLLSHPSVQHLPKHSMLSVEGDASGVTGVTVKPRGGVPAVLAVEGAFLYVAGAKPITDFLKGDAVEFDEGGGVVVDAEMATNVPGVYAIGDIRNTPFKQVVVAASDGCIAAMAIDKYLKGRKSFKVDWIHDLPEGETEAAAV